MSCGGRIDSIDEQIIRLYEERMDVCRQVAEYKIETGKKVYDRVREEEKLAKARAMAHSDFTAQGIGELFEQIMSMSRKLQYQLLTEKGQTGRLPFFAVDELYTGKVRVVFQGAEGAYSQAAMVRYFGEHIDSIHVDTFRDAMGAIEEGSADFAVLPIENSTAGIVSEILRSAGGVRKLYRGGADFKDRALSAGRAWRTAVGYQDGVLPSAVPDAEFPFSGLPQLATDFHEK